jgi:glycosyltransferase 2 family protein
MLQWHANWVAGLRLLLLSVLSWIFYGIAYALFIGSLTPIRLTDVPLLAGVNALSFLAGYAALVAPGGLGVREAAMTGLLLPLLPTGVAALVSVASRLWTIAAELIGGLFFLRLWSGRGGQLPGPAPHSASKIGLP